MLKDDIVNLYILLRKYKSHEKAKELVTKHYFYKVKDLLTEDQFNARVSKLVECYLERAGLGGKL